MSENVITATATATDETSNWTAAQWAEFYSSLNKGQPQTVEQWVEQLAKLPAVEYDQQREAVAKKLGIRVSTLDAEVEKLRPTTGAGKDKDTAGDILLREPENWPSPVGGAELLNLLRLNIENYVILPAGAAIALALWVLHTYLLDAADCSPIIAISSPEKRCGKTVVLELLQVFAYRPLPASNITAPALFRIIEAKKPTLLIDEADTFLQENEALRGVLNSGHRKASAVIIRCVGDNHDAKTFSTWCAKAIALIGNLPATIADRSINIRMRRKSKEEKVERIRQNKLVLHTSFLSRQAARWAKDNLANLRHADPVVPDGLNDRAADCWRPLLAIADAAGGDWPELARSATSALAVRDSDNDGSAVELLADIRNLFQAAGADKLFSESIITQLVTMEHRRWPEWRNGKPLSKSQLARILNRFEIVSKSVRIGSETQKGYHVDQFIDAFARYLDSQNVTPTQPTPVLSCDGNQNVTPETNVTLSKTSQPTPSATCDDVTFSTPLNEEKNTSEVEERL